MFFSSFSPSHRKWERKRTEIPHISTLCLSHPFGVVRANPRISGGSSTHFCDPLPSDHPLCCRHLFWSSEAHSNIWAPITIAVLTFSGGKKAFRSLSLSWSAFALYTILERAKQYFDGTFPFWNVMLEPIFSIYPPLEREVDVCIALWCSDFWMKQIWC